MIKFILRIINHQSLTFEDLYDLSPYTKYGHYKSYYSNGNDSIKRCIAIYSSQVCLRVGFRVQLVNVYRVLTTFEAVSAVL